MGARLKGSSTKRVALEGRRRKIRELGGDRAVQLIVGNIELLKIQIQLWDRAGEVVVVQIQSAQPGELIKVRRDLAGEVVSGEVKSNKVTESEQKLRNVTGEKVSLQVEVSEVDA